MIRNRFNGFLVLLLFLLLVFYSTMNKNRGVHSIEERYAEYHIERSDISAYHKITLGIPININKESVNGLTAIPGIGNSLARKIEKERKKRKGFKDINELKSLPGIGEKLFSKIAPYIRL